MKKILLVGGAGFIGSHLTHALTTLGHEVYTVDPLAILSDIDDSWLRVIQNYRLNNLMKDSQLNADLFQNVGSDVMKSFKPDIIVHLGAVPLEGTNSELVEHMQIVKDTSLTYQIAKEARKHDVEKVVYMSSLFAYGNFESDNVAEDHPLNPVTPYGIDKAMGEHIIKTIVPRWNFIRTTSIYGFGDANLRSTSLIMDKAIQGKEFWINDDAILDFIYIKDLIAGIVKVIFTDKINEDFHITGGQGLPLIDYVEELKKHFDSLKYTRKTVKDRPDRGTMINRKAKILLDWEPKYSLKQGVKEYAEIAKAHGCG